MQNQIQNSLSRPFVICEFEATLVQDSSLLHSNAQQQSSDLIYNAVLIPEQRENYPTNEHDPIHLNNQSRPWCKRYLIIIGVVVGLIIGASVATIVMLMTNQRNSSPDVYYSNDDPFFTQPTFPENNILTVSTLPTAPAIDKIQSSSTWPSQITEWPSQITVWPTPSFTESEMWGSSTIDSRASWLWIIEILVLFMCMRGFS